MNRMDKLRNLLVMAAADGHLTEREINYLTDRCQQWDIHFSDVKEAIGYALSPDAELVLPHTRHERIQMLKDLIQMMAADGKLENTERELFAVAAAYMEISRHDLDRMIDELTRDRGQSAAP